MADLNESFDSSASLEFPDLLIEDDERCHRRFMFTSRCNNDIKLYLLNHPKTNTPALFEIAEEGLNEVFQISSDDRSVIYGETVIKKGEFYMCSPLHPFFLLVSTLADKIFVKAVKTNGQAPPMYLEYDSSLRYFTFQIFSDYLSEALTNEMRCVLEIEKPAIPTSTSTPATAKRKVDIPKAEKRPPPLSVKQRKLKEASKGVQSLTMFFNKAP
uniref:Ydr279_N domain-containing protein n=1 Tax=Bursaphelenchus xylophilus TaxID=6326 RepID=A0A1I7RHN0_BURXY